MMVASSLIAMPKQLDSFFHLDGSCLGIFYELWVTWVGVLTLRLISGEDLLAVDGPIHSHERVAKSFVVLLGGFAGRGTTLGDTARDRLLALFRAAGVGEV